MPGTARSEVLSDVDVDFNWRSTVDAARGNGTFAWRGEPVAFRGEIDAPLTLLAGGDSPLRVSVEAAPANLSFEGMARQFDGMQIEGEASLAVPSVARFGAWTGALGETSLIRAASIAGKVSWAAALLNLSEMTIDLDGNAGEGALTATVVDGKPSLQGTLDFTRFDLTPQLDALRAAVDADGAWRSDPIGLPLVTGADVDLRLSAGQAVAGATEVGPVAASLLVKDGIIRIEVGEAHLGEGIIEASLLAEMKDGVLSGAASLKADGIPAEAAAGLLGISGVTGTAEATAGPQGKRRDLGRPRRRCLGQRQRERDRREHRRRRPHAPAADDRRSGVQSGRRRHRLRPCCGDARPGGRDAVDRRSQGRGPRLCAHARRQGGAAGNGDRGARRAHPPRRRARDRCRSW